MAWDDLAKDAIEENKRDRDRWISAWIGLLAVVLAVCGMGGANATKDATLKNIEAANTWSFFQAKNQRREMYRIEVDQLEFMVAANPAMPEGARLAIADKVKALKARIDDLSSNEKTGEGLDQLFKRGKSLETERDLAMRRDPYFDYATALLQIAIVLASVAIIANGHMLLLGSVGLGILGALLTLNGFTLAVTIPFIG